MRAFLHLLLAVSATLTVSAFQLNGQTKLGTITAKITDKSSGEPLPGVTALLKETGEAVSSNAKGYVTFKERAGSYLLNFNYIGYGAQQRKVELRSGENLNLNIGLTSTATALANVSVAASRTARTERALLSLRRKSGVVQDAISAEQIEKTASITTAQALGRVTGVSVRDGKYITVRGLTDRNLVVQLNGSRLSSANAERSAVPLDIIPAQLLESITVEKTVTPDKPGDATGAVVEIKTKPIPDTLFYQLSVQEGFNSAIGLGGFYNSYPDANLGGFGQRVSNLNLSSSYKSLIDLFEARGFSVPGGNLTRGLSQSVASAGLGDKNYAQAVLIDQAAKSFSPYFTTQPQRARLNQIYNLTFGNRFRINGSHLLGVILGLNYYNRYQSNPGGVNNLYSVREINASTPNIAIPNELDLVPIFTYRENTGDHQLNYGGLATLSYRFNVRNEVSLSYNGNFGAEAQASYQYGNINDALVPLNPFVLTTIIPRSSTYNLILHSTERALHTFQAKGEHKIAVLNRKRPWKLDWSASRSSSRQNDPDYRNTRVLLDSSGQVQSPYVQRGISRPFVINSDYAFSYNVKVNRYFRNLSEKNQNYKFDLTAPFRLTGQDGALKAGAYFLQRNRDYKESTIQRFDSSVLVPNNSIFRFGQPAENVTALLGNLDAWNSPSRVGVNFDRTFEGGAPRINYIPIAQAGPNSYHAVQRVVAAYLLGDFSVGKNWRLIGGARIENTDIQSIPDTTGTGYATFPGTRQQILSQRDFNDFYVTNYLAFSLLPSGTIIYNGINKVNLRLAYSKTITRPELNEIVSSSQNDPLQQATLQGNKRLLNGSFRSYDFRTDFFPRPDELFSVSAYFKQVESQIERVYLPRVRLPSFGSVTSSNSQLDKYGDASSIITFRNNPNSGYVYGLEFEVRKKLDQLFAFGKHILIGTNLLLSRSTTKLSETEFYVASQLNRALSANRPLIDQPLYALNVSAGLDQPKWGSQLNVLYNRTGKRLIIVNVDGTPNIYEYPAPTFDITYIQKLGKRWQLKAFAKNILNEPNQYLYATPANTKAFGTLGRVALNRSFAYGAEYTMGINFSL